MYRICLAPLAQQTLLTLSDPLRREVGRQLALTAEVEGPAQSPARPRAIQRLELLGLSLTCAFDRARRTLTVRRIAVS